MNKVPLGVVYCRNQDCDFSACGDSAMIRAIGNLDPKFPDEVLYIKNCKLIGHSLGECEYQTFLNRLPSVPIFFYKGK